MWVWVATNGSPTFLRPSATVVRPRPVEAVAVGMEAVGLPHAHADRGQPVGRDDGLDLVEVVAEVADGAPDVAPLLLLGELAADA